MSGGPCSLAPLDWAGLGAAALHDRTPQFSILQPVYLQPPPSTTSTIPLPTYFPLPPNLAINHNPSLVISSPVNKVEKPSHNPFPFLFNQVSRPQPTPQRHSQPPFPKQTVPAPDGIDLAWSRDECRLASLSSLRPRASALPLPRYALLTLHLSAPCRTHLQAEAPCGSRARAGHLRWSAQRRLLGSPAWPTRATPPPSGEPPF